MPRRRRSAQKQLALTIPGVELLRLCHAGMGSGSRDKQVAALSMYSLVAFQLRNEIIAIPKEMVDHYKTLAE